MLLPLLSFVFFVAFDTHGSDDSVLEVGNRLMRNRSSAKEDEKERINYEAKEALEDDSDVRVYGCGFLRALYGGGLDRRRIEKES